MHLLIHVSLSAWPFSPPGGWPFVTYCQDGFFAAPSRATCRLSTWKTWISWGGASNGKLFQHDPDSSGCFEEGTSDPLDSPDGYKHGLGLPNYDIYRRKMVLLQRDPDVLVFGIWVTLMVGLSKPLISHYTILALAARFWWDFFLQRSQNNITSPSLQHHGTFIYFYTCFLFDPSRLETFFVSPPLLPRE